MTDPNAASDTDLRYPVGRMTRVSAMSPEARRTAIGAMAATPAAIRKAVTGLTDEQLDTPYRPGGWTVRQVVHHVADSHMNAYIRIKFALTESDPTVKPYDEAAWARLEDCSLPVDSSLAIIEGVHARLDHLLRTTPVESFARTMQHPENGAMTLDDVLSVYSWHGRHHTAHVTTLRDRMQWR